MAGQVLTTEEMLHGLSVQIRLSAYTAIDCANHLAIHSAPNFARTLNDVAGRLGEIATIVRSIGDLHDRSGTT